MGTTSLKASVTATAPQRVFPLHLSPIENFMLADDQPGYPMTFVIELQLGGQIDRAAFEAALDEALPRHPLLRALIKIAKGGLPCWMQAEAHRPELDWACDGAPASCATDKPIDLTREIGLRIWVCQGSERATVTLQFHHACTDGTGAYRFIGDLLAAYGIRTAAGDSQPELGEVDAALLRGRKDRAMGLSACATRAQRTGLALREFWKILRRQPAPLAPPDRAARESQAAEFPGFVCYSFDRARHECLRSAASVQGVTLNDLLLRDLFVTLDRWQDERLPWFRSRRLRIMMPADLRGSEDYLMPATNMAAYTFLACARGDARRPAELLRAIRDKTAMIKHQRSGTRFMDMIYAAAQVRWLLPLVLRCRLCLASAILSNVTDPSRRFTARLPRQAGRIVAGNLVLEEMTGVPPLRPWTRATFSVSQYDRRLTISLRCDPHLFRLRDTASLLDLYVEQLNRSADAATARPPRAMPALAGPHAAVRDVLPAEAVANLR
jgi:hypothetical protein